MLVEQSRVDFETVSKTLLIKKSIFSITTFSVKYAHKLPIIQQNFQFLNSFLTPYCILKYENYTNNFENILRSNP